MKAKNALRVSGFCGLLSPFLAFLFIFLAVSCFPNFDFGRNALSDLAGWNASLLSALFFNFGLIVSGVLSLVFAAGLRKILPKGFLGVLGFYVFVADAVALCLIGVFPETAGKIHFYVSVAFFTLFPLAMFLIGAQLLVARRTGLGVFTFIDGIASVLVWLLPYGGLAVPETLAALAASFWSFVLGAKMLTYK
ncbi:MAG: DUF998 domain-containing protein [Candidatus Bathyarchaeia archaeon]